MSLHYIIDGYNLIKHRCFNPSSRIRDQRLALFEFIRKEKLCGSVKNKVTVVFDGYAGDLNTGDYDIEVIFSQEQSADDKIKKIVQMQGNVRNIVVISDDREIKDFVKLCGMKAVGIEEFIQHKKKHKMPKDDESLKPELTYSMMLQINRELRKTWLKDP
jgi:predicted RNA-binding protein with PIN domain